jgi:hypothetical protein
MNRRQLIHGAALGAALSLGSPKPSSGAPLPAPPGFANSKVAIGRGVYSESKVNRQRPHLSKVPGTMVSLAIDPPMGISPFLVTIFAQYSRDNSPWKDTTCYPAYREHYEYRGALRDVYTARNEGQRVTLFVPDDAFWLKPNLSVDIRFEIRFFDMKNVLLGLSHALPPETLIPRERVQNRIVDFGRGDEGPPFEYYDVSTGQSVPLD